MTTGAVRVTVLARLAVGLVLMASCAVSGESAPATASPATTSTTITIEPWPVGPEFTASEFDIDGETRRHPVALISLADGIVDVSLGACGYGGNTDFRIEEDRLVLGAFGREDIECDPQPQQVVGNAAVLEGLFLNEPHIRTTHDSITLETDEVRITLTTSDPAANRPVAPTGTWFQTTSSTDPEIDTEHVSLIIRAIFVLDVQLESCLVHTQVGGLQQVDDRDVITGVNLADCPNPNPSDQAALRLLDSEPALGYTDDELSVTGSDGTVITLE